MRTSPETLAQLEIRGLCKKEMPWRSFLYGALSQVPPGMGFSSRFHQKSRVALYRSAFALHASGGMH